jgi:SOS-response transcriptional repressor LexA
MTRPLTLPLTARQQQALDLIRSSLVERGFPPTLREMGEVMGIRSTNGVNDHVRSLERKGYLARSALRARGLRLLTAHVPDAVGACHCAESMALRERVQQLEQKLLKIGGLL